MAKFLVTGGGGFFGSILKRRLLDDGAEVVSVDLVPDNSRHPALTIFQADIRDEKSMRNIFAAHKFDVVFHVAAMLAHGKMNNKLLWTSNVDGTGVIAGLSLIHIFRGGFNDPGPTALDPRFHGAILVSLQSAISLFRDDAQFYNPLSYLIGGLLLAIWFVIGVRSRFSPSLAPMALASISALSMLPVYHRQHDLGLLLLTVPACALLWSQGKFVGRCALFITAGAAIFLNNLILQFLAIVSAPICAAASGFSCKMLALLLTRPAPIVLLALAVFYLWAYAGQARMVRLRVL